MNSAKRSIIELNLSLFIMGGTTLFPKLISLPVNYIIFGRCFIATIALYVYLKVRKIPFKLKLDKTLINIILSGVLLGFHWISLFEAIKLSTVSIGILSFFTYPIITVFLEKLFFRSKIFYLDVLFGILVFIGLVLVFHDIHIAEKFQAGFIWGIISAFLFSLRMIISKKLLYRYSGEETMLYQVTIAAVCLAPIVIFNNISFLLISFNSVLVLILLGVVFTALPHTLLIRSLSGLKPKTVGILSSLQPLYCIFTAFFILKEVPSISVLAGGIIIISTVMFETLRSSS